MEYCSVCYSQSQIFVPFTIKDYFKSTATLECRKNKVNVKAAARRHDPKPLVNQVLMAGTHEEHPQFLQIRAPSEADIHTQHEGTAILPLCCPPHQQAGKPFPFTSSIPHSLGHENCHLRGQPQPEWLHTAQDWSRARCLALTRNSPFCPWAKYLTFLSFLSSPGKQR